MKLNPMERITLLNILPKEGTALTLRIIRDLQVALAFTEDEYKDYVDHVPGPNGTTNEIIKADKLNVKKDVAIGEKAEEAIVTALKDLSEKKTLHISQLALYDKFVEKIVTEEEKKEAEVEKTNAEAMQKAINLP